MTPPSPECFEPPLDPEIAPIVLALRDGAIETFESCSGGTCHAYPEPTVRFYGGLDEGFRAFSVAKQRGLDVLALRRVWDVVGGEPTGPWWEMTFRIQ